MSRLTKSPAPLVACPACRGVIGFVELHVIDPVVEEIEHRCAWCASTGLVGLDRAAAYWAKQRPTA